MKIGISTLEHQDDRTLCQLGLKHIARTGSTAREMWKLLNRETCDFANIG